MAYVTLQNLIDDFGAQELVELTNDRADVTVEARFLEIQATADASDPFSGLTATEQEATLKVVGVINKAIAAAESLVASYVQSRLTIPIGSAPPIVVRDHAASVVRYKLHKTPTREVQAKYDEAVQWLRDAAKGLVNFGADPSDALVTDLERIEYVQSDDTQASGRIFTQSTLSGYSDPYNG